MKSIYLPAVLFLSLSIPALAQDKGYWRAASQNAESITGDIAISETKISIDYFGFPIAHIRALTPTEIGAIFDADSNVAQAGNLYRLNIAGGQRFLRKNTLCGTENTQWMATYVEGRTLHLAFFSGPNIPVLTFEAIRNSTDVCGNFLYKR